MLQSRAKMLCQKNKCASPPAAISQFLFGSARTEWGHLALLPSRNSSKTSVVVHNLYCDRSRKLAVIDPNSFQIKFFVYFLGGDRVCWSLLCIYRPLCIFERYMDSNPERTSRRATNLATYLPNLATHLQRKLPQSYVTSSLCEQQVASVLTSTSNCKSDIVAHSRWTTSHSWVSQRCCCCGWFCTTTSSPCPPFLVLTM